MEAASARAAATRDRWGEPGRPAQTQLLRFIGAACSPENFEPNLAMNLEISDLINSKKGTAPREAATAIVQYINHRNGNVALLALGLLDICVKNCGYPFHLQISTKEFLNELVRRFPERPPIRSSRVQEKILEAIEEWRRTICETSRYKEDLGFIRDMHRLLQYKGYTFPEVRREDAAVLNPSDNLKSAEEMEEEEREAQSAKLQELIRRGSPEDLQEANRLMKIMAGFDTRSKTDFRAKAAEDVAKVVAKARLLEERLDALKRGDDTAREGDVFEELVAAIRSAQPKIAKMCEEESDDTEAVAKLFEINDGLHRVVERYLLVKKGDLEGAAKLAAGAPLTLSSGKTKKPPANDVSLIDLDGDVVTTTAGSSSQSTGVENDLLGLSIGGDSFGGFGQGGGIALGFGANAGIPGPALLSSITPNNSAKGPVSSSTPPPFASLSQSSTPQPAYSTSAYAPPPPQPKAPASDPFAAFASPSFSSSSKSSSPKPPPAAAKDDDDEWAFVSAAAPPQKPAPPREFRTVVSNAAVKIELFASRPGPQAKSMHLLFAFSNNSASNVAALDFQLAWAKKTYDVQIKPQTGQALTPKQSRGITQANEIFTAGDHDKKVESVRLRWRVKYVKDDTGEVTEMGEIPEFTLA